MSLPDPISDTPSQGTTLIQWIVDTRPLWPEAVKTQDLEQIVR